MDRGHIRFIGNVDYGTDIHLDELRTYYAVIVFATGAIKDARLDIPGVDAENSFGAADFVNWYDGHPDVDRHWDLSAKEVAVIGNGNVDRKSTRLNSSHVAISYAVFCLKKKKQNKEHKKRKDR